LSYPFESKGKREKDGSGFRASIAGYVPAALAAAIVALTVLAFALPQLQSGFRSETRILVNNIYGYSESRYGTPSPRIDRERQLRVHAEIAASHAFALDLVKKLDLGRHPDFSNFSSPSLVQKFLAALGLASADALVPRDELLAAALKRKMRIAYIEESPVLFIRVSVSDPELAAALAAQVANSYARLLRESGLPSSSARPISYGSVPTTFPFGYSALMLLAAAGVGAFRTRIVRRTRYLGVASAMRRMRVSPTLLPEQIGGPGPVLARKGPDPTDIFSALLQSQR
jgi:hypothetical protein